MCAYELGRPKYAKLNLTTIPRGQNAKSQLLTLPSNDSNTSSETMIQLVQTEIVLIFQSRARSL